MTIWFDMDGTIADLYGVDDWLKYLQSSNTYPYEHAEPLYNCAELVGVLETLKGKGYRIGIISWLAKNSTKKYDAEVRKAKKLWLQKHGLYDIMDNIRITAYGVKKSTICKPYGKGILIDDEAKNLNDWKLGATIDAKQNIMEVLKDIGQKDKLQDCIRL